MGSIYFDTSSRGVGKKCKKTKYHNCYRAEYIKEKKRYRKRFQALFQATKWLDDKDQKYNLQKFYLQPFNSIYDRKYQKN